MAPAACPVCGAEAPPPARFCAQCGQALAAPEAGEASQRILTLVFVDLVESTALAARADLEGYDTILTRFHETVGGLVQVYRGTVLQHYGDGALACFGLRQDGEDAALAAIAAALSIRDAVRDRLDGAEVRAGIHRGTVFCRMGEGGALKPQITGLAVNTAARVQDRAAPGKVVISEASKAFVARIARLETRALPRTLLKGLDAEIGLFEVEGYTVGGAAERARPLYEREAALAEILAPARAGGGVAVLGPAGIGKTAVIGEVARRAGGAVEIFARYNLRFSPFYPLTSWLADRTGYDALPIPPGRAGADPRADLAARIRALLPDFAEADLDHLADVLNLPVPARLYADFTGAQLRAARIAVLARVFRGLLAGAERVLLFDDFHWADPDSLAVVAALLDGGVPDGARVVLTGRPVPEMLDFVAARDLATVTLKPLSDAAARQAVMDGAADRAAAERIVATAEGNPLYLWTLLEAARRDGAADVDTIEATFQGIINSFEGMRRVILAASVIGRRFTLAELSCLAEGRAHLADELESLALGGVFERDGAGFAFGHILLRDAAYNMLPGSRRRELHRQFADRLAERDPKAAADFPEVLAEHYLAADDAERILASCRAAGLSFMRRANFDLAVRYLTAAHDAVAGRPEAEADWIEVLTLLASAQVQRFGFAHPVVEESYSTLRDAVAGSAAAGIERMRALYGLLAHRMISGHVRDCRALAAESARMADPDDSRQQVLDAVNQATIHFYGGRLDAAADANARVRALYRAETHGTLFLEIGADPLVTVLSAGMHIDAQRGDLEAARAGMAAALAQIEAVGAELQRPWIEVFGAVALHFAGERAEAGDLVAAGIARADAQGAAFWSLIGRIWQAAFGAEAGRADAAETLAGLLPGAVAAGVELALPVFWAVEAGAHLRAGRLDTARRLAAQATRRQGARGEGLWAPFVWRRRGEVARAAGDAAGAARAEAVARAYAARAGATAWFAPAPAAAG